MKTKDEQIQELIAACVVKDEALRRCRDSIQGFKDTNPLHEDSVLNRARKLAVAALDNSPAAAQEMVERMERMDKALREISSLNAPGLDGSPADIEYDIAQAALSTIKQPEGGV